MEAKVEVKVDATGEKRDINGVSAQRYFLTTTVTAAATGEQKPSREQSGQLVLLQDMWLTKDGAYKATQSFGKARAEEMGDYGQRSFAVLFGQYPNAHQGFKRAAEEMNKLDGVATRTVTYLVTVQEGVKFDREKLFAEVQTRAAEPEKKKGGLGGLLKAAAKAGAGANPSDDKPSQAPAEQVLLFTSTTDISDVKVKALDAGLFTPPAGYKKVTTK